MSGVPFSCLGICVKDYMLYKAVYSTEPMYASLANIGAWLNAQFKGFYIFYFGNGQLVLLNQSLDYVDVQGMTKSIKERFLKSWHANGGVEVPLDVDDMKVGKDFLWASASKRDFQQNVCVYALPLSETYSFEDMRDSVMKVNIPGDRDDRWMETDRRTVNVDDITRKDLVVVRGLWDMRNDAMGGPFVSYVYADTVRNRFLVVEGFVFAPDKKKRPIMRQLEAALQTVTFEDGK